MEGYTAFADVYDEFMDDIDYQAWSRRIAEILREYNINDGLVLDLGCGTGNITGLLAEAGYDMTGVDSSFEMLQKAIEKRDELKADILYLCQDMREFELYGTMAAVVSTCDCVNYITDSEELLTVFKLVNNYLDPGGIFIFDFNTKKKYESIGNTSIAENREDSSFIWENYYDGEEAINEYQLTLFIETENGMYRKYEEYHVQKGYEIDEIRELIKKAGMEFLEAFDGYSDKKASLESERIVVVCREHGK